MGRAVVARGPAVMSAAERRHAGHEAKLGLGGVLGSLPVLWVNHPGRHADAGHKPRQLVAAAGAGLDVAPTLVTNDAGAVRRFALTHRVTQSDLHDLRGVELTAHQYQWWASKREEARVIVIDRQVFAVAIRAGSTAAQVDWRADYSALTYEPIVPPITVARGVLAVMSELDLLYGAFDFVIGPDGRWTFLEVNPGGQFGWLEDATGVPLTAAVADLLIRGAR